MYFDIIRAVLDESIPRYAKKKGISTNVVDQEIAKHIEATANEHNNNPDPNIDYDDYLCRLGYLFVHAGANGTLMERTLRESEALRATVKSTASGDLSVCTVGGGPGTEILGLFAYFKGRKAVPARLNFTVLDRVQTWSETWRALARLAEQDLHAHGHKVPMSREFQTMDVTNPEAFVEYERLFGEQDIIVFNYLLSENKVRLSGFRGTLAKLIELAKPGAHFVFIDRIEYKESTWADDVEAMVRDSKLVDITRMDWGGCMAETEEALSEYITRFGGRRPRRWFRTKELRKPTAFSIVASTSPEV